MIADRPEQGYSTIVADPPWDVERGPSWSGDGRNRPMPYPTMSLAAIGELQVSSIAADDAHLYIWTINKYVEQTYDIARQWGFRPVTLLTWCKPPIGLGLGGAYVQTSEHVLFCRRGKLAAKRRERGTWWQWPRREHSRKPEAFLDMVEQVSPGPYLEMFARRARLGWDTWGNQALGGGEAATGAAHA